MGSVEQPSKYRVRYADKTFSSKRALYEIYARQAKQRGYEFQLSIDEFGVLTKGNCYYCGVEPKQRKKATGASVPYIYNGIDRINNSKGYILSNVRPCCKQCNYSKDVLSEVDFLAWIRRVYEHRTTL